MLIISEVGSPEYYELRAIEEIHAARSMRQEMNNLLPGEGSEYHAHITKAIQLLLLARLSV